MENLPFDIPNNWMWVRHNSIFEIFGGSQPPKSKFIAEKKPGYIRLYQIRDYGTKPDPIYIPLSDAHKTSKKGDILLARYGASVGKVFFAEDGAYNVAMAKVEKLYIEDHIDKMFLYLFYKSSIYQSLVLNNSRSAQAGFNKEDLNELLIPIPPLQEQNRIINRISLIEPLILEYAQYEEKLTSLEEQFAEMLRKSILQYAIEGKLVKQDPNDEPASALLERIKAEKEALIKAGKIKRDKNESLIYKGDDKNYYENLPKNWSACRFDSFTLYTSDYVANGSFKSLRENVTFYKNPNYALLVKTQDFSTGFKHDLTYTDKHGYEYLQKCHLYGGELIMSNIGASIGKIMIMPKFDFKCALAPNSILVKCIDEVTTNYLKIFMSSYYGQNILKEFTAGTAMPKFSKTQIRETIIPVPPYEEQKRILEQTNKIFFSIDN